MSHPHKVTAAYKRFKGRKILFILGLIPLTGIIFGTALSSGSADISVWAVCNAFLEKLFPDNFQSGWMAEVCVWHLRLPRIIMGITAGLGLGGCGAVTQAVLRNPMASPYTLGIASGAGFGASLAILTGIAMVNQTYMVIGSAFFFSLACSAVIIGLSNRRGATPETMILAGIALTFLFSAATTTLQYFGDADAVKESIFWMVGDLGRATWSQVFIVILILLTCIPLLIWKSWDLNVMGAGDDTAVSLGVKIKQVRVLTMAISSFLVAGIVCFTGTIGFVGLAAPHICRMIIGNDNRFLLPASGFAGAVILVAADTLARRMIAPVILPIGVLTSFLGAPLFLLLIMKNRRAHW